MKMPDSKYCNLLPLLDELRENRNMEINYDPVGYQEKQRNKNLEQIEKELDEVFVKILKIGEAQNLREQACLLEQQANELIQQASRQAEHGCLE